MNYTYAHSTHPRRLCSWEIAQPAEQLRASLRRDSAERGNNAIGTVSGGLKG